MPLFLRFAMERSALGLEKLIRPLAGRIGDPTRHGSAAARAAGTSPIVDPASWPLIQEASQLDRLEL